MYGPTKTYQYLNDAIAASSVVLTQSVHAVILSTKYIEKAASNSENNLGI